MVDARRLDQGAATERPPFRRLDIAARRRDGLGKRGVQPATDLAIGRLEHIDRRDATQAQPQPRLRIVDEEADGRMATRLLRVFPIGAGAAQARQFGRAHRRRRLDQFRERPRLRRAVVAGRQRVQQAVQSQRDGTGPRVLKV